MTRFMISRKRQSILDMAVVRVIVHAHQSVWLPLPWVDGQGWCIHYREGTWDVDGISRKAKAYCTIS